MRKLEVRRRALLRAMDKNDEAYEERLRWARQSVSNMGSCPTENDLAEAETLVADLLGAQKLADERERMEDLLVKMSERIEQMRRRKHGAKV